MGIILLRGDNLVIIKIEKLLQTQNKSLYWLAQETGLSYPTIHRLTSGKTSSMAFDTLNKLCYVLNCNTQDIIEYIPDN